MAAAEHKHGADSQASHPEFGTAADTSKAYGCANALRIWMRERTAPSPGTVARVLRGVRVASSSSSVARSARWGTGRRTRPSAWGAWGSRRARGIIYVRVLRPCIINDHLVTQEGVTRLRIRGGLTNGSPTSCFVDMR
jgi:hypothetical protein